MAIDPAYTASGLSSGLNDTAIIQSLVNIQQQPITLLQNQQSALQTQVSDLGSLASDLTALQSAADGLAGQGTVASKVTSSNQAFSATAGTQATAGTYQVQVTALATAAKSRSSGFASSTAGVTGGSLALTVQGTAYNVQITDGESLSAVAQAINALGAPVQATLLSDGTHTYLEVTGTQTGFPVGTDPTQALSVTETDTGSKGQALALNVFQQATNAALTVDDLPLTRQQNTLSDVIPGVTISLQSIESSPENLVIGTDASGTAQNLQAFISAYNTLNSALQAQLNAPPASTTPGAQNTTPPLQGDASVLGLQSQLQQLLTMTVPGVSGFNSLASIGITSDAQTGALSLNTQTLDAAVAANPASVNALFSQATTGISATVDSMTTLFADPATGALTQESQSLQSRIQQMGQQETRMQAQLDSYQQGLQQQFAAMEQVVSGFKSVGNFLTEQATVLSSKGSG